MTHDTTHQTGVRTPESHTADDHATDLHFAYTTDPPDFERFDVKAVTPGELLGTPCTFAVIGQSHLVSAPGLGYHEVCSCDPLPAATAESTALEPGATQTVTFESDHVRAETTVQVESLDAFPGADDADVAHRFAPDAWTTIAVSPAAYETYHTYPERDASVRTRTRLARGDGEARRTEDETELAGDETELAGDERRPESDATTGGRR
ncbi:DUF2617 family protein [Halogeometricum limi]|uniref:Uncharacterized protein n=1 Tax=Halogeometricum limi TaxID=555875 RepID=A0A1I6IM61_9EURY|nr:DUF2617 family protein [Halogeometricum limi]SFR67719.1 Protein of unknown function DUF2617 [Halogeometricum limi]